MAAPTPPFSPAELAEAHRAIASTLGKCEKIVPKLRPGTAQHTLLDRRIRALEIALALIERELAGGSVSDPGRSAS
jgi:hypothetical protein